MNRAVVGLGWVRASLLLGVLGCSGLVACSSDTSESSGGGAQGGTGATAGTGGTAGGTGGTGNAGSGGSGNAGSGGTGNAGAGGTGNAGSGGTGNAGSGGTGGTGNAGSGGTGNAGSGGTAGSGGSLPVPDNHRPTAEACDNTRPSPPVTAPSGAPCSAHGDCTTGLNGRCLQTRFGYECSYDQCLSDSDCSGTKVCACEGSFNTDANTCLSGDCQVDSDCGSGSFCSPSFSDCGNYTGVTDYYCRTADDECLNDSDCVDPMEPGEGYCAYSPQVSHWVCSYSHCVG